MMDIPIRKPTETYVLVYKDSRHIAEGPFSTREAAENHQADLAKLGVETEIA